MKRIMLFKYYLIIKNPKEILLFCTEGLSFYEKGWMAMVGRIFGKKVYLSPRSGKIEDSLASRFFCLYFKIVVRACYKIICQGEYWKNYFAKIVYSEDQAKLIVIPNGIDMLNYLPKDNLSKNERLHILYMGWLVKEKGIWELLFAYKKLLEKGIPPTVLQIAGDGPERKKIEAWISQNNLSNEIALLSWVKGEKKRKLLSAADIFVLPSFYEGMPNALLEAMCVGLACIATNVGAVPNMITEAENGFLIESGDVEALTEKMGLLINEEELRVNFGDKARLKVKENYSLDIYVHNFENILT